MTSLQRASIEALLCFLLFETAQSFSTPSIHKGVAKESPLSRRNEFSYKTLKRKRNVAVYNGIDSPFLEEETVPEFQNDGELNYEPELAMAASSAETVPLVSDIVSRAAVTGPRESAQDALISIPDGETFFGEEDLIIGGETVENASKVFISSESVDGIQVSEFLFGQKEDEDFMPGEFPDVSIPNLSDLKKRLGGDSDQSITFDEPKTPGPDKASSVNLTEFLIGSDEDVLTTDLDDAAKDAIATTSENVGAVLAAAAEAEATLSSEVADSIPLLPNLATNGTSETVEEIPKIVSAPSVVGDSATSITPPNVKKILTFAIPAIGVWLCGPLLSLIDTSAVGLLSGTTQQAALNPAVAVTDYAALLIAFMYTATTNLVAAAQETDRGVEGKPRTTKTLISSLKLSGFVGLGLGTVLFTFARILLRTIIGNDGISPKVFAAAMKYVRIRALGMPAAAVIGSAQAACLGMQDIRSPLYVLVAAAVVNLFGDMLFVGSSHPLLGGAAGAAWATVFSQYAALSMFIYWLKNKPKISEKPKVLNLTNAIMELTGKPEDKGAGRRKSFRNALKTLHVPSIGASGASKDITSKRKWISQKVASLSARIRPDASKKTKKEAKSKSEVVSARGFLEGRFGGRDLLTPPSKEAVSEFAPYVLPVTTTQVGRVSSYVAMSHVVSSSLGTVSMAAQQVIVSLFYCLCPIADSLSLTAQSFVPSIAEKKVSRERATALRNTSVNFVKAGMAFGAVMVAAVGCIPLLSQFFTSDPWVVSLVNSVTPLLVGVFAVHGVLCAVEGLLLGQKDLSFLGRMYAAYFAVVPWLLLRVKKAALAGNPNVSLASVWRVFLSYQLFRSFAWVGRLLQLQARTNREAAQEEGITEESQ